MTMLAAVVPRPAAKWRDKNNVSTDQDSELQVDLPSFSYLLLVHPTVHE
jgi:hypothetical protein